MQFHSNLPIYIQIMEKIKLDIINNIYEPGSKLPSARELAKKIKVNPNTVQRAYQELEFENLVFTQRGMGTYVVEDLSLINNIKESMAKDLIKKFIDNVNQLGLDKERVIELIMEETEKGNEYDEQK